MIIASKKKKKDEDIAPVISKETKQAVNENITKKVDNTTNASKIKKVWSDGYQIGDVTKTILNVTDAVSNISPVSSFLKKGQETGQQIASSGSLFKESKPTNQIKQDWSNGYQIGDITKSYLNSQLAGFGTAGDIVANMAKGELQTAEGLVDTARYILSDTAKGYGLDKLSEYTKKNAIQNTTGVIFGENDANNKPIENGWLKKLDEYSVAGNALDQISQSVGQQAFRIGLQQAIGSTGASEGVTKTLNQVEIFAGSYGSAKSEALMNGASDKDATIRAFISGTAETISENLFDSIPGFKTGELSGISNVKNMIFNSTEKAFGKNAGKVVVRIFNAAGEGVEEGLSNALETAFTDIANCIDTSYTYGMKDGQGATGDTFAEKTLKLFEDTFGSAFNEESKEAFITAFFSTLITGAVTDGMTNAQRNEVIKAYAQDNNISVEAATQLFDGIRDLRANQVADNSTSYEDRINLEDQITNQLSQEIKNNPNLNLVELQEGLMARNKFVQAVGAGQISSRGLDLVESYKAYNGDNKYTNEIENIQKFMSNRNINARFDATMFDNNEQNAIWTTENGQDSVVFNPNASQEQVIQSIATHEMTHDILNQKIDTGTSLFNDVLEEIKTQENYAEQRKEIEDLYAKYYDRNSEDFTAKVDEEMVANELGKNLGTQEYINRLVGEKPNLARRIYNWVVDKLDNIGKSEEYKEQKAYWKSVADKFEKAYNEQKTATGEDKTAYSLNKDNLGAIQNLNNIEGYEVQEDYYPYDNVIGHSFGLKTKEGTAHLQIRETANEVYLNMINTRLGNSTVEKGAGTKILNNLKEYSDKTGKRLVIAGEVGSAKGFYDKFDWLKPTKGEIYDDDGNLFDISSPNRIYEPSTSTTVKYSLTKDNTVYRAGNTTGVMESGTFFTSNKTDADNYGKSNQYQIDKTANLYNGTSSKEYAEQNNLMNIKNEVLKNKLGVDTLQEVEDIHYNWKTPSYLDENPNLYHFAYQYMAREDLENKGYDGVVWKHEDDLTPQQYQIWNNNKVKNNTKYSLTKDSQGRTLSKQQQEYFKDSKVVDRDGNLMVMYHGTPNGDFTVFRPGSYFSNRQEYAGGYENTWASSISSGKEATAPKTFEVYLNITNPFTLTNQTAKDIYINEYIKGGNSLYYDPYTNWTETINNMDEIDWTEGEDLKEWLQENHPEYDGLVLDEGGDGGYGEAEYRWRGKSYVPFNSNAIKNIDNLNPTEDADIRYSMQQEETPFTQGTRTTMGELFENNIAPIREDLSNITEQIEDLSKQIETLQNGAEISLNDAVRNAEIALGLNDFEKQKLNRIIEYAKLGEYESSTLENKLYNEYLFENVTDEEAQNIVDSIVQAYENEQNKVNDVNEGYIAPIRDNYTATGTPLTAEEADLYQNALMNDEAYLSSLNKEAENYIEKNEIDNQTAKRITNKVASMLSIPTKQTAQLEEIVRKAVKNEWTTDEIANELSRNYAWQKDISPNDEIIQAKKIIRDMPIKVSDSIKKNITDYGDFQKKHFGKIHFANYGSPVDSVYQELTSTLPGLFSTDILNDTDQLLRIAEVVDKSSEYVEEYQLPTEYIDNVADYINEELLLDKINTQTEGDRLLQNKINYGVEDAEPVSILSQNTIDDFIENRDIAPVRQTKAKTPKQVQRENAIRRLQEMFVNKFAELDKLSQATQNSEITAKGSKWENASGQARNDIDRKQTNNRGEVIGKGVKEIWQPIKDAGMYEVVNDYLIQKSNIERHAVGKGSEIPLEISKQLVNRYETEYPNIKELVQPIYTYFDNVLQNQVDSGLISQDKYKDYRGETGIYRSYVPFYPGEVDRNRYYDNEGRLKAVSTLKRSKGNAGDTNRILAIEDSMIKQTYGYKNSIDFNELAQQIVSTSKASDTDIMDFIETNPYDMSTSLQTDAEGTKYLTAYFDGKPTTIEISNELYNELSRENENRIKQFEEDFSMITNPLQRLSSIRRDLLTTKNPVFLIRNVIKDVQDAVINSKHTALMLKNYLPGLKELAQGNTKEAQQFLALYGTEGTYGNYESVGKTGLLNRIAQANELLELAPRFAEFKASLQSGESVDQAMYNAREVTTNFSRGGYVTKALNRNGFTFLNANVQGLDKIVRNLSGQNGVKGVTAVVTKGVLAGVIPAILNHMLYGSGDDKDEDYEALPDYIKDNYYLIKLENGEFLRIPKGRVISVIGSGARRTIESLEGEENAFEGYLDNAWSQIGVGDSGGLQTIFTPLTQAFGSENGTAWYGGDIVPTRLQNKPAAEQYDEKTDELSKFLGEKLNISPKKINYVLDQYSGGIGDILLPMMTPATSSGAELPHEYLLAPIKDSFVVNSTDDNKYAGEFYELKDKLQIQSNGSKATDEDKLKYKYLNSVSSELSELYANRREIQSDTTLSKSEKYNQVQEVQRQINSLSKEALDNYNNLNLTDNYASIGGIEYYKNNEDGWTKVNEKDTENTAGMTNTEKQAYFDTKTKISTFTQEYNAKTKDLDKDSPLKTKYSNEKKEGIMRAISKSGLSNQDKANLYISALGKSEDTMTQMVNAGFNIDTYVQATYDIANLRERYSKEKGYSTEQRKAKTLSYINSLDMDIPQKAMLIRQYYTSFRDYNKEIVNYVSNLNISYEEKVEILKGNGMKVDSKGNVKW